MSEGTTGYIEPASANKFYRTRTKTVGAATVHEQVVVVGEPIGLTARMLAKAPTEGYEMWVDPDVTTNLGAGVIMAEAVAGTSDEATTVWRGVFIPTAAGRWVERTGFAWGSRTVGW